MPKRRDRTVGAGYEYQWDVALYLLVRLVLRRKPVMQPKIAREVEWLGPVTHISFEGVELDGRLEDFGLRNASSGKELHIQIKESDEDLSKSDAMWRPTSDKFVEFMDRIAVRPVNDKRRILFLTSGAIHKSLDELTHSKAKLKTFYDARLTALTKALELKSKKRKGNVAKKTKNKGSKTPTAKPSPKPPLPPKAHCVSNWAQVRTGKFIAATRLEDGVPADGVGFETVNELNALGASDPQSLYTMLFREVMTRSFVEGGTELSIQELREWFSRTLAQVPGSPGNLMPSFEDYLRNARSEPTWEQLEQGHVWSGDPFLVRVQELLDRRRLALLVGGQGAGKTVLCRLAGRGLIAAGYSPLYWDFEHLGARLPHNAGDIWRHAVAVARVNGTKPALVLENVHLSRDDFHGILGRFAIGTSTENAMTVLASSRTRMTISGPLQAELSGATLDISERLKDRAFHIVAWWLEHRLHLAPELRVRIFRSVNWSAYVHDLVAIRLALEALDVDAATVVTERVDAMLEARLSAPIATVPGAAELLYVVCALGRAGLSADMKALAVMLERSDTEVRAIAEHIARDGLLSIDHEGRQCRLWHESLAQEYWEVFQSRRPEWAISLRDRYRSAL